MKEYGAMNKIYTKTIVVSFITLLVSATAQARTLECSTKIEVGENFETKENIYERDVKISNKEKSIIDLSRLTITNAETKNKIRIMKVSENLYVERSGEFVWQYLINPERTIVIETSMTKDMVYVAILRCDDLR
jgi:hypothetical protein